MEPIGGRTPTGRQCAGPCTDLIELVDGDGLKHTCVQFHEKWRDHEALRGPMDPVRGLMAQTGVIGLPSLVDVDMKRGAWVYATGTAGSVAEIVAALAEAGESGSVRAGLELCYLAAEVLLEAADLGRRIGLSAHGSLDPQRLLVRNDGQVLVLGYGLPALDVDAWIENARTPIHQDSLRYAPPERFTNAKLDISADLFSLTLVGIELMVGKPVYDGLFDDIAAQARNGDAVRRIYGWRDVLPATVQEALLRALKPDPDSRYRDGVEYLYAVHDLLSSIDADGPPLVEVVARYRGLTSRDRLAAAKATGTYTAAELAELTADLAEVQAAELKPPKKPRPQGEPEEEPEPEPEVPAERWASRGGTERRSAGRTIERRGTAAESAPPASSAKEDLRSRLQRGRSAQSEAPAADEGDARSRLRNRLRDRSAPSTESEAIPARPRRRGRLSESAGAEADLPDAAEEAAGPEPEPPPEPTAAAVPEAPDPPAPAPTAPAAAPSAPPSAAASAAALLERLRGGGATAAPTAPPVEVAPDPDPAPEPPTEISVSVSAPPRAAPIAQNVAPEPQPSTGAVVALGPDGSKCDVELVGSDLQVAAAAAAKLGLASCDLSGHLERTWVFRGAVVPGAELELTAVDNAIEIREVVADAHRFRAPVGRAVPADVFVAHLRSWLGLTGAWHLDALDGTDPSDALVDDLPEGPITLVRGA